MNPVRVSDSALADIAQQLDPERAESFVRIDLLRVLRRLAEADDLEPLAAPHGPGWRFTDDGVTVAGYHIWLSPDPLAPEPGALLVYRVDVWSDHWPDDEL